MRSSCLRLIMCLCSALAICQPSGARAADSVLLVVTRLTGNVAVQSYGRATQDVEQARILHFGDTVVTGLDSRAAVSLADTGKVTLGPGTVAKAYTRGSKLALTLVSGSLCIESDTPNVSIAIGSLTLQSLAPSTTFNLARNANDTQIAVYRGNVLASVHGAGATTLKAGTAADSAGEEPPQSADIAKVNQNFAALHCPDEAIVAQVIPPPHAASGGGGGGILAALLGIGAIAAAVGHGGGSSAANQPQSTTNAPTPLPSTASSATPTPTPTSTATPTPPPTPTPTPPPTPTPTPGSLALSPTTLSFSGTDSDPQDFDAHDSAAHSFSATSRDTSIASVALDASLDHSGNRVSFRVTPNGNGTTTIDVRDDAGGSGSVSVTVGGDRRTLVMHNRMVVAPLQMSLAAGTTSAARFEELGYTGQVRAVSSNPAIASVSPAIAHGPSFALIINGRSPGSATIVVSDDRGMQQLVRVFVSLPNTRPLSVRQRNPDRTLHSDQPDH